jgi:hypothetical protein
LGNSLASNIVLRRSQPATHDHRIAALEGKTQDADNAPKIVSNLGLKVRVDSVPSKLLAEPTRVRINDLAQQQLGANRNNLTTHNGILADARPHTKDNSV